MTTQVCTITTLATMMTIWASSSRRIHITKWAQSAIVPDPTNVLDYNRFMYTRGNPLKYNDPTGHCAANDDGSPDFAGDAKCYERAAEYYYTGPDSLRDVYPDFGEYNKSFATAVSQEGFESMLCGLWCAWYSERGAHHERYNREPTMHPIPAGANMDPTLPGTRAALNEIDSMNCTQKDCVALALDGISVAGSGLTLASPACGPAAPGCLLAGQYVGRGATGAGAMWTVYKAYNDEVSYSDGTVATVTTAVGLSAKNPKVGLAASIGQFFWDLFSGGGQ